MAATNRQRVRLDQPADAGSVVDLSSLLNTAEVAKLFNRSQLTIQLWRKHKQLPYIRIRGARRDTIRYDLNAVRKWAVDTGNTMQ
jgi:phage terminase Nu1 subunit (DNA packaging protein)